MLLSAAATSAVGAWSYISTRDELLHAVDRSLDTAARTQYPEQVFQATISGPPGSRPKIFDQVLVWKIDNGGAVVAQLQSQTIEPNDLDVKVAVAGRGYARHDAKVEGEAYRVLTVPAATGGAILLARSLAETNNSLDAILRHTLWAVAIAVVASAIVGWLIGRQLTRRLERLTAAATQVASTGSLDVPVPTDGTDEAARLGTAFSGMLGALARSRQEQTQLVQDAGHELRTPLTSLRTNVAVLRDFDRLDPEERSRLLADLDSESRELTDLVNELVELATDRRDAEPFQHIRLGDLASRVVDRVHRRTGRDVQLTADNSAVDGQAAALERAMINLVDNAAKFSDDGPIEVRVEQNTVIVRDHGPGIRDVDLPHVFDRFFRAVDQRSKPGSGLGLAIVKSVVDAHHGTVFARNAEGGGAELGFRL
ncbi:MAG: HAMP domain-containing sensor histidine kinase [Ilumatobacteraceae bacterium]